MLWLLFDLAYDTVKIIPCNVDGMYISLKLLIICQNHKKHVIGGKLGDNDEKHDGIVDEMESE